MLGVFFTDAVPVGAWRESHFHTQYVTTKYPGVSPYLRVVSESSSIHPSVGWLDPKCCPIIACKHGVEGHYGDNVSEGGCVKVHGGPVFNSCVDAYVVVACGAGVA